MRLIAEHFQRIFSLGTLPDSVAKFGVHLIAKCAL